MLSSVHHYDAFEMPENCFSRCRQAGVIHTGVHSTAGHAAAGVPDVCGWKGPHQGLPRGKLAVALGG
jgi:hypothetical protein